MTLLEELTRMEACEEAVEWVADKTLDKAWAECERGDWMLWLAQKSGVDKRTLTLAKARCAKLVLHLMKDERSVNAVEVAERYGLGEATDEELDEARRAAHAAYTAYTAVVDYSVAAYVATHAAYAAYTAAHAAADVGTAYAVAYATASAAYDACAGEKALSQCADICRQVIDIKLL